MRFQINAFLEIFRKKCILWYLGLFLFCSLKFIQLKYFNNGIKFDRFDLLNVLGNFNLNNGLSFISSLFSLYQIFLTLLTCSFLFKYEEANSPEFCYLRADKKKILFNKFLILVMFILVIRIIYFGFVMILFNAFSFMKVTDLILNIGIHLFSVILISLFYYCNILVQNQK